MWRTALWKVLKDVENSFVINEDINGEGGFTPQKRRESALSRKRTSLLRRLITGQDEEEEKEQFEIKPLLVERELHYEDHNDLEEEMVSPFKKSKSLYGRENKSSEDSSDNEEDVA